MSVTQEKKQNDIKKISSNKPEFEFKKKSSYEKICYIKSNVTVEPILVGLSIATMFSSLAIQNLNLDKACRINFSFGDEICNAIIEKKENMTYSYYEGKVQKLVTSYEAFKSILSTSVPAILVVIMGAWSDRTGNRKICILLPIVGEFLVCLSNIMSTVFIYEIPVELTMFFESFFPAFSGGWVMMYLGVFSYAGDITTEETRTFRMGIMFMCVSAGFQTGTALSGILVQLCGYYGVFTLSATIHLITFLYGYFYLESNTKPVIEENKERKSPLYTEIFSMIKETVKTASKKRNGNIRTKIFVTLVLIVIIYGPDHGERGIKYLFTRYHLKWDALKYSFYSTINVVTHTLGALFSITVFSKLWGWHDSVICMIAIISKCIGSIYICFVHNDVQMFIQPFVEIFADTVAFTALQSMASKMVEKEESGKLNSLLSLVQSLAALVFDPIYSTLYSRTVTWFSGTVYLFSVCMTLPAISILLWLFTQHRQEINKERKNPTDRYVESDKRNEIMLENARIAKKNEMSRI